MALIESAIELSPYQIDEVQNYLLNYRKYLEDNSLNVSDNPNAFHVLFDVDKLNSADNPHLLAAELADRFPNLLKWQTVFILSKFFPILSSIQFSKLVGVNIPPFILFT